MAATGPGVALRMVASKIVEVTACCYISSPQQQIALNVRHYFVSAQVGLGCTQGEMATLLDGVFAVLYKGLMSLNASYRGIRVRMILPAPPVPPAFEVGSAGVGSVAGDLVPWQTAGVLSFGTQFAGRAYRGRCYVGFASEGDNTSVGVPSAGYVTALGTLGTAWTSNRTAGAGGNTSTITPMLLHRASGTVDALTGSTARTVWGTQRRRSGFGKQNTLPF